MENTILDFIGDSPTAPFLFVGSGFSRRYLGTEGWSELLEKYSDILRKDYNYYLSSSDNNLPKVASLISKEFNEEWWVLPEFDKSRVKYGSQCNRSDSALKIEISIYMKSAINNKISSDLDEEIAALKKIVVDGIITTNWDNYIETIFKEYKTYIGQDELIFSSPQGVGEIYKIHGCCSIPNSLVLTDQDYKDFNKRNPYLAAKLLTIFTEHPVIFIGYSISDENILDIIKSIASCLSVDNLEKLQDRLIFVEWDENQTRVCTKTHTILSGSISIPVKIIRLNSFTPLYKALGRINRKFPANMLRLLKEHVYDLVLTKDKVAKQLYVQDINEVNQINNFDVVLGVGAIKKFVGSGYVAITRDDIMYDIIYDDKDYNSDDILFKTISCILNKGTKYIPFFKYLVKGKFIQSGELCTEKFSSKFISHFKESIDISFYSPSKTYRKHKVEINKAYSGFKHLIEENDFKYFLRHFSLLSQEKWNSSELSEIIIENIKFTDSLNSSNKTGFYILICFYDYCKYYLGI